MPPSSSSSSSPQRPRESGSDAATAASTEEQDFVKDAALALAAVGGSLLVLKALAASITLYLSLLPLVYVYGLRTCPPAESFDAKAELRRALRGDQLPDDDARKPKPGTFQGFLAGAMATLQSELATLPGYEVEMWSLGGAAWVATVILPTADLRCTWIGCNHRWYFRGSTRLSKPSAAASSGATAAPAAVPQSADITIGKTNIKIDFGLREKQE